MSLDPDTSLDPFGVDCDAAAYPGVDDDDTHVVDFVAGMNDPEPAAITNSSGTLFYYQMDRSPPVGNGLRVVKLEDAGDPSGYVITISF